MHGAYFKLQITIVTMLFYFKLALVKDKYKVYGQSY
jgi:hypothetical protein